MASDITVFLDFKDLESDDENTCHGHTFQPPGDMNFEQVCDFFKSQLGHGWEDGEVFDYDRINVWALVDEVSSGVYIPPETMTVDEVAGMFCRHGFIRTDNDQTPGAQRV